MTITILALIFLAAFIVMEIFVDEKEIGHIKDLQHRLMLIAKKQCEKTIGIIVELNNSAESMIKFIEHLKSFDYDKLKVVIVATKLTDKEVRLGIINYLKNNPLKDFRLINQTKGTVIGNVVRRNLSSQLVVILDDSDRLSKDFFTELSIEALKLDGENVLLPRHQIRLADTLASLFQAHFVILRQLKARLFGVRTVLSPIRSGVVYSRHAILSGDLDQKPIRLSVCTNIYISKKIVISNMLDYLNYKIDKAMNGLKSIYGILSFAVIAALMTFLIVYLKPSDLLITTAFVFSIYVLLGIFMQIRMKGYSLMDNINLILIAPMGLLFEILIYILGFLKLILSPHRTKRKLSDQSVDQ